jgi:aspartyl-tRNA(Asn)/glutamyl-tRNA(Gln) amidotransferase subunit C
MMLVLKIFRMKLTREDVQRVAVLARLRLTAEEESEFATQLATVLDYMAKLNELDTSKVEPLAHGVDIINAFREDKITNAPNADAILANAPERDENFFKVPKIVE